MPRSTHPAVSYAPADHIAQGSRRAGRHKIQIDEVALYNAALTHASFAHLGEIFGVSAMRLSQEPFRTVILRARAVRKQELLAAQFNTAINDRNPTMQIWLGKQYLDQKDVQRVEQTGPDGAPIKHETAVKAIAYFPENNRTKQLSAPTTKSALKRGLPPDPAAIPTHGTADLERLAEEHEAEYDDGADVELMPAEEPIDTVKRATGLLPTRAGSQPATPVAPGQPVSSPLAGPPGSPAVQNGAKAQPKKAGRPRRGANG